jgi:methyltransferase (TIGR00027 family)
MHPGRPSTTAEHAALLRAVHQLHDRPLILEDPVVLRLIDASTIATLRTHPEAFQTRLRASIAVRSRYAEDCLRDAVDRGTRQYVILGAGLDSFAYRNPFPPSALHVFEVDHPPTQAWKRQRLRDAGIEPPGSLTFVPVDFERQTLAGALVEGGLDPAVPTFVSWLGVTMYLARETVMRTLAYVASLAAGSAIVFGYVVPPSSLTGPARAALSAMAARAAELGEPWLTFFEPDALAGELERLGLGRVEDVGPEQAVERYFRGRSDRLRPGGAAHLVRAMSPAR